MKIRYYFWQKNPRGWRQLNNMTGYATIKDLKRECGFEMAQKEYPYKIMKATPIRNK